MWYSGCVEVMVLVAMDVVALRSCEILYPNPPGPGARDNQDTNQQQDRKEPSRK